MFGLLISVKRLNLIRVLSLCVIFSRTFGISSVVHIETIASIKIRFKIMSTKIAIENVNQFEKIEFVNLFKNAVELWPKAAESVASKRPIANLTELIAHFTDYLDNLSVDDKVAVLKSHPDLAGKLLDENKLSDESAVEQALAGLNRLTAEKKLQLIQSNAEYAKKFGFPFVICVRQNNKIDSILDGFQRRLPNTRDQEITNGIEQVKKICQLRIELIVDL